MSAKLGEIPLEGAFLDVAYALWPEVLYFVKKYKAFLPIKSTKI